MKYYRCKCGKCESYESMPPDHCDGCSDCGTNLALSPKLHHTPEPHDFSLVEEISTDQGIMTRTYCKFCRLTKEEITKRNSGL